MLTCAGVQSPPHQNTEAEIRQLESDDDWEQSRDLGIRCYGYDGPYLERRARARRRLTRAGRAAWFGAFEGGRLLAQLGVCDACGGLARYQDVETDPAARRRGLAGTLVWRAGRYAARRSARARSSSWPTRPRAPSGSTGPADSPTSRASSASSGPAKDKE